MTEANFRQKGKTTYFHWILMILLSLITTMALSLDLGYSPLLESFSQKDLIHVVGFVIICFFSYHALQVSYARIRRASMIFAPVLAIMELVGYAFNTYDSASSLWSTAGQIVKTMIGFIGFSYLFYCLLVLAFAAVCNNAYIQKLEGRKLILGGFFVYWGIIFICWVPYYLTFFPAILTPDSNHLILQATGHWSLSDHHPIPYTMLIRACFGVCSLFPFFGNIAPLALYSLAQMLLMSATFAFGVWYLKQRKVPPLFVYISLAYFALLPIHAMYSITMWKDQPFSCCVLLLVISLLEMTHKDNAIIERKKNIILFCTAATGAALLRHNGTYIILLMLPVMSIFLREYRKVMLILLTGVIGLLLLLRGPIYNAFSIGRGSIGEALSVPLQQIARTVRDYGDELTQEDLQTIDNLYSGEGSIGDDYEPRVADSVKNQFVQTYFDANAGKLLTLWIRLGLRYPATYIESLINGSFGYWYPGTNYWVTSTEFRNYEFDAGRVSLLPSLLRLVMEQQANLNNLRKVPVISMLYSIGFSFFLFVFTGITFLLKRKPRYLIVMLPVFLLWITCVLSPVYAEFRYIYGMIIAIPILLPIAISINNKTTNPSCCD